LRVFFSFVLPFDVSVAMGEIVFQRGRKPILLASLLFVEPGELTLRARGSRAS
jgi:hypothetical protein